MICEKYKNDDCCNVYDKRKELVTKENKCEYSIENKSQKLLCRLRIDDCLIKNGRRCDYGILNCDDKVAYLVELKGRHLLVAVEQISQTIDKLQANFSGFNFNGRVV